MELNNRAAYFNVQLPADISKRGIYSDLIKIIGPAAIEYMLLQFVSMFDHMQVASLGEYSFAAVGLATQVILFFTTAYVAINVGVTVLVAHALGGKKTNEPVRILEHGLLLCLIVSTVTAILGYLFAGDLLSLFGAPDHKILLLGTEYLQIRLLGILPLALTATFTAAFRGVGNTKTPLFYNLTANLLNIGLNWLLINGNLGFPALGIRGAAIATVIGQFAAFGLGYIFCMHAKQGLRFRFSNIFTKLDKSRVGRILNIGLPSMVESLFLMLGGSIYTKIVASLGTSSYATHAVCINIQTITYTSGMAFSVASTTLVGQCLGRNRKDLAILYSRFCLKINLIVSLVLMIIYSVQGPTLIGLYINDPGIIAAGTVPLRIVSIIQPFAAFLYVYSGALRGAGDTKRVAVITIFAMFVCRPLLAYCAIYFFNMGLNGAWWALSIEQMIRGILIWLRFTSCKWMDAIPASI